MPASARSRTSRRHELRDARARQPASRIRLRTLDGGLIVRRARRARSADARRRRAHARAVDDLLIADDGGRWRSPGSWAARRPRSPSGRVGPARGRELRADRDPASVRAALAAHRGLEPVEKGVDPYLAGPAAALATQLLVELPRRAVTGAEDVQGECPSRRSSRYARARRTRARARGAAEAAGRDPRTVGFERHEAGYRVPTWRARDVTREIDLVEEVARFELPEIPFTLPRREAMFGRLTRGQRLRRQVEDVLVGAGYAEVYTPSFVADGDLRLPEPLRPRRRRSAPSSMRRSLEPARRNADAGEEDVALFEIARVYRDVGASSPRSAGTSPGSPTAASPRRSGRSSRSTRRSASSPRSSGRPSRTSTRQGGADGRGLARRAPPGAARRRLGRLRARPRRARRRRRRRPRFEEVSPYPEVRQDLAFVVAEEVPAAESSPRSARRPASCCASVEVFDEYRNPSRSARESGRSRSGSPSAPRADADGRGRRAGARVDRRRARDALRRRAARLVRGKPADLQRCPNGDRRPATAPTRLRSASRARPSGRAPRSGRRRRS